MQRNSFAGALSILASLVLLAQVEEFGPFRARYDGVPWQLEGAGIVCCPCSVPCPCRSNGRPSYGHCEATLFLRIDNGHYGDVSLKGMQVVSSGGMCANRENLAALYFAPNATLAQQSAFMKLWATFSPGHTADFPHVRVVPIQAEVSEDTLFKVTIPGTLEMTVDRNWGENSRPMPMVAAQDYFSNALEYAQNIRYRMHDAAAGLDFDYSHRQANYRKIDLADERYRSKKMLVQLGNGKGWFTPEQLALIREQHLLVPDLRAIEKRAVELVKEGRH